MFEIVVGNEFFLVGEIDFESVILHKVASEAGADVVRIMRLVADERQCGCVGFRHRIDRMHIAGTGYRACRRGGCCGSERSQRRAP